MTQTGPKPQPKQAIQTGVELPESVKLSAPRAVKRAASWLAHRRVVGSTLGRSVGAKPRYLPQPAATKLLVDRVFLRLRLHDLFQASGWVNSSTGERAADQKAGAGWPVNAHLTQHGGNTTRGAVGWFHKRTNKSTT